MTGEVLVELVDPEAEVVVGSTEVTVTVGVVVPEAESGGGVSLGETSSTAYRGDRGKIAYDHSQTTTGNPHNVTAAQAGADPSGSAAAAQAHAIQRANHTGTQAQSTITNLPTDLLALADAIAGKAPSSHTHAQSDITNLTSDLSALAAAIDAKPSTTVTDALDTRLDTLEAAVPPWSHAFEAGTAINTTTAEQTATTITGPTVATGDHIEFRHAWRYLNNSGAQASITVRVKVGTAVLTLTAAPNMSSNAASRVAMLTGNIRVTGASAGQIEATLTVAGSTGGGAAGTAAIAETISGATLAVTTQLSSSNLAHESQLIHGAMRHNPAS